MKQLNIVLVEPQIPQNTGNIARTCAATGARLHLVGPMGFAIEDKKLKRAGLDYWHLLDITLYGGLDEFFCPQQRPVFLFQHQGAPALLRRGLPGRRLPVCLAAKMRACPRRFYMPMKRRCVRLPMRQAARSLNLSNSVAVGVYEALRQHGFPDLLCEGRLRNYDWGKMV